MTRAEKIRDLCQKAGISVTKLEQTLGYGNGSLTKRNGNGIKYERLQEIADFFNVDINYLLHSDSPREDFNILLGNSNQKTKSKNEIVKMFAGSGELDVEYKPNISQETLLELQEAYNLMADASPEVRKMVLAMLRETRKKYDQK